MKRILFLTLFLWLFIPTLSLAETNAYFIHNPNPSDRLHLRVAPQESATSLGRYYNGAPISVLEENTQWVKIRIGKEPGALEGYVNRRFLSTTQIPAAMPEYMSRSSGWELYNRPDLSSEHRMMGYGESFYMMGFSDHWWHVMTRDGRLSGFTPKDSLDKVSQVTVHNPNPSDRLNLRKGPQKSALSLGKYYNGVSVTLLGYAGDGQEWAQVRIGTLEGYMESKYLSQNGKSVASAMPQVKVQVPAGQTLHLRQSQSETSASLGRYSGGTTVQVYGISTQWYHVKVGEKEGFMLARYLTPTLPQ